MSVILDASAILAMLFDEPGGEQIFGKAHKGLLSAVNLTEVIAKCVVRGIDYSLVERQLSRLDITIVSFVAEDARMAAELVPHTRRWGLSLADRACLALALKRNLAVWTADHAWAECDLGIDIRLIR
ncbi:MAG: type II toxin-antitoxin system VapC family toxin [Sphingobium sp.]|nr:type II toxin-antitoxin system VapC family toxin [Sphingobium sp.]